MRKYPFIFGMLAITALNPLYAQDSTASAEAAFNKTPLEGINTSSLEVRPLITPDGSTLYFSRRYSSNSKLDQDIYVAHKDAAGDSWGEVKSLEQLNNKRWNAVASVSPDGKELVLYNTYKKTENSPLVRTIRQGQGWSTPEVININGYENFSPYSDFFVAYKQEVLLLAIETYESNGEQDLYVSFPDETGKGWSKPVNMGTTINSTKADFAPFVGADGKTLFFSSFGHNTLGGSDIFMSVRLDDSWTNWSTPVNLGPAINTADDENYFSIDRNFKNMYYSSQKAGERQGTVAKVALPEDFTAINGPVLAKLDRNEIQRVMDSGNAVVSPNGRTKNAEGITFAGWPQEDLPVAATEDTTAAATTESAVASEAKASSVNAASITANGELVPARLDGFVPAAEATGLSAEAASMRDFLLQELPGVDLAIRQKGNTTEFKLVQNILYDFNSVYANMEYQQRLSNVASVLKNKQNLKVQLIGHTDSIGSEEENIRVAKQRVNNVLQYLTRRRIDPSRIEVLGVGLTEPVASNDTDSGRSMNRRVETIIRHIE
jgi:OOP family OmpA-OmpF porin